MEISCNVVRDLLPLYAEDMVSEDSRKIVEEHVCECDGCSGILAGIREKTALHVDADLHGMERVEENIRRRKNLTVATAVLLTLSILVSLFIFLTVPVWLSAEEAIESVTALEDGRVKIQYTDAMNGRYGRGHGFGYRAILCWTVRIKNLLPQELPEGLNDASYGGYDIHGITYVNGDEIYNMPAQDDWWYLDYQDGTVETLLYDAAECTIPREDISISDRNTILIPVLAVSVIGTALFALVAWVLRKTRAVWLFGYTAGVFGSHAAAILLVTSGKLLIVGTMMLHLLYIPVLTALYFVTGMVAVKLLQTRIHV